MAIDTETIYLFIGVAVATALSVVALVNVKVK